MRAARFIYVIMPVGSDPFVEDKKRALRAAIEESGREAIFPIYSLEQPSFSLGKLIEELREAEAVVADLSYERPSCYYELGIAEAIGKLVHLIAKIGTPIHQCTTRSSIRYYLDVADIQRTVRNALREKTTGG